MRTVTIVCVTLLLALHSSASADALRKAWRLLEAGDREKAREIAAARLAKAQNTEERGEAFLILALSKKDGEEVAGLLEEFLSDFPNHALQWRAEMHLGFYYYALGTYVRAATHFEKAGERKTARRKQIESRYWLGLALLGAGNPAKAKQHFELVMADDAGTALADDAALGFADCLREEGKYSSALAEYMRVVRKYRRSDWLPSALYGAGVCLEQLQKKGEAVEVYVRLAKEFPTSFEAAIVRERVKDSVEAEVARGSTGSYTVQVGAFSEEANANGLVARLKEKGVADVRIVKEERGGRILYIVHLGEFSTKEAAERKGKELSARFGLSYSIVPK